MTLSQQKFIIRSDVDLISARMAVREFARNSGFNMKDQASISIASASLANSMLTQNHSSGIEMLVEYFESEQKHGIHVFCTKRHATNDDHETVRREISKNSRWLVDDVQMKPLPMDDCIEIMITKWDSLYKG